MKNSPQQPRLAPEEIRRRLDFPDAALIDDCTVQTYKASGPGGQHRNKVTSAIRLVHPGSGLTVTASESPSQHENRARAVKRMREAIALAARVPLPERITWPENVDVKDGRLRVNERNPALPHVIALVLDSVEAHGGRLAAAAAALELTTSSLARFLEAHPKAWGEANAIRARHGLGPMKKA